ncbi:unnamed protein product [Caenorhabditis brenneri]
MTGNSCGQNDCESLQWIRERIHDKKHFTARSIAAIVDASGMEAEMISKILSGVLFGTLVLSDHQSNENGTIHNHKTDSKPQSPTGAAISTFKPLLTSQKKLNNIEKEPSKPSDPAPEPKLPSTLSRSDIAADSQRMKTELNPMQSFSFYNLKSESESRAISPGNNLHDMMFSPFEKLGFNAPFDINDLTYHMKIRNNSHHRIAFAVKGNAVPRVMANPVVGVLEKGEQRVVAVTVKKFIWNETDFEKDRIAFDYVLLPDDNKEKEFKMTMFQNSDTKRRKNIMIVYNP